MAGEEEKPVKPQIWSWLFIVTTLLNLCICTVGQAIAAGTPLYVRSIGGSSTYSGIVLAVYMITAICTRFVVGPLTDKWSRKGSVVLGASALAVGSFIPVVSGLDWTVFISRILQGFGFACSQNAINTCAADILPWRRLSEGLGYFGLGQALAMALGPTLAIWLVGFDYHQMLSLGLGLISVVLLLLSFLIRYEKNPASLPEGAGYRVTWERRMKKGAGPGAPNGPLAAAPSAGQAKRSLLGRLFEKKAFYGAIPMFFVTFGTSIFIAYTSLYAQSMGFANPSSFFFAAAIVAIAIRLVSSKIMNTFSPLKLMVIPAVGGIAAMLGLLFFQNELAYTLCGIGQGACIGIAIPLLNSVAVKASSSSRWGSANALFFLMNDAAFGLGTVGWGAVLDVAGFDVLFVGGACAIALAFVSSIFLFRRMDAAKEQATSSS